MKKEKKEKRKRLHWRFKVLFSIFVSVIFIVISLFGITYLYFEEKFERNNKKIAKAGFVQAEKELKELIGTVEGQINSYTNLLLPWEFVDGNIVEDTARTRLHQRIVQDFDRMLSVNNNLYAIAAIKQQGHFVLSTSDHKSRSGKIRTNKELDILFEKAKMNYPYLTWISKNSLKEEYAKKLEPILKKAVLIGIKYSGEEKGIDNDTFIMVSIAEKTLRKTYDSVAYNGSVAALIDAENRVISASSGKLIGTFLEKEEGFQTIEYPLSNFQWKLVNHIPKNLYRKESEDIRKFGIMLALITCFFVFIAGVIWSRYYTRPIQYLMDKMKAVEGGNLEIDEPKKLGWDELDELNEEFFLLVGKLREYINDLQIAEREKTKEELLALQYQINPHFILGSINSIRWMATMTNNLVVANALEILAKILTPILRNSASMWKLRDELKFSSDYVSMMNIRYGNTMEYRVICEEGLYDEEFPRLILQPMIENCFIYGSDPVEKRSIVVRIKKEERIMVSISNSGVFMSDERLKSLNQMIQKKNMEHIGLSNVRKRLEILYKEAGDLWLESNEEGDLIVQIRF